LGEIGIMTVTCKKCGKELDSYPFESADLCLKCVLDTKFQKLGVYSNEFR
jgi:NMD protein affecting ribosome stability and mRNA decay